MDLKFGMQLQMRADTQVGEALQQRFRHAFLIGWNENAYVIASERGSYDLEYFSGHPSELFIPA